MSLRNAVALFRQLWITPQKQAAVIGEYRSLAASHPHLLADIALRGGVGVPAHVPGDPYTTAWNDGRRALAQEILALAGADPDELMRLVERKPQPDRTGDRR